MKLTKTQLREIIREELRNEKEDIKMAKTLANKFNKCIDEVDPDLAYYVFAQAVAKVLKDEYGTHNFKPFIKELQKRL